MFDDFWMFLLQIFNKQLIMTLVTLLNIKKFYNKKVLK